MRNDQLKTKLDGLSNDYLALEDNAAVIVRQLKKTPRADIRSKLIGELRNIDKKRIEILNQIDDLSR